MKRLFLGYCVVAMLSVSALSIADEPTYPYAMARHACTAEEKWVFPDNANAVLREEFEDHVSDQSLLESITAQIPFRAKKDAASKALVSYWTSRQLFSTGLTHAAHRNFDVLIAAGFPASTMGVSIAAVECMNRIHSKVPALQFTEASAKSLIAFAKSGNVPAYAKNLVASAIYKIFREKLSQGKPQGEVAALLPFIEVSPIYQQVARGLLETREGRFPAAIAELQAASSRKEFGTEFAESKNDLLLTLGRLYYSNKDYKNAILTLRKVDQTSNAMPNALEDLSWSYLQLKMYAESMAAAASLQVGDLRRSFVPEAPTVAAIALYELCQYPESLKAAKLFRHLYASSFRWLGGWEKRKKSGSKTPYYAIVAKFLKGESTDVPDPIVSEWIRSSQFVAFQEELNAALDAQAAASRLIAKMKKESPSSPEEGRALKMIRQLLASEVKYLKTRAERLVPMIDSAFDAKTESLAKRLGAAVDNVQLVEIDLYNRASEDIIFKSTHPEFAELAKRLSSDEVKKKKSGTMDFGGYDAQSELSNEVWDDEIGRLNTNLPNVCKKKEKYLEQKENEQKGSAPSSSLRLRDRDDVASQLSTSVRSRFFLR